MSGVVSPDKAAAPPALTISSVPAPMLQRACACGGAAGSSEMCEECAEDELIGSTGVQAKLSISQPNDPFEREADSVADRVMSSGSASALRPQGSPLIYRSVCSEAVVPTESSLPTLNGGVGSRLPADALNFFEPKFGRSLDHVRVHDDPWSHSAARSIGARAFTHGRDIYFDEGEFDARSYNGRHLLAHELAHVFQQSAGTTLRRQQRGGAASSIPTNQPSGTPRTADGSGSLEEIRHAPPDTVTGITMSCQDMRMRIETARTNYWYHMETCSVPLGDYSTQVTVTDDDFRLDFGTAVSSDEEFAFSYRVEPGQTNPARLLADQNAVDVHVVEALPMAGPREPATPQSERPSQPECVVRLRDRELIPRDSYNHRLFEPITVPETTLWRHEIPLGWFGWGEVSASVSASVTGQLTASYGPGMLTDICLTHLAEASEGSAPIQHPLLGSGSRVDSTVYGVGGRAHFNLPARASLNVRATGTLRVAGDWLSSINVAEATGTLSAIGTATLSGSLDAGVDILARFSRDRATLEHPILPLSVTIEHSQLDGVDLTAEIGLRGRAALSFQLNAGATFSVLGRRLWSQNWNLVNFNAGVGWQGGLVYSPNPGLHWDLGEFGSLEGGDNALEAATSLDDVELHEDEAEFDSETILPDLFEDEEAPPDTPRGTPNDPLPFEWRKPSDLYPAQIELPNADDPPSIRSSDGPTTVSWHHRGRLQHEELGVADWPYVGATFDYYPYDPGDRKTPNQRRFNDILDRLGYDRSGLDAEHVWDVKLRGLEWDRFDNLWPASDQDQQLAGGQHMRQIRDYERQLGNVNGLQFVIIGVRHPAR